MLRWDFFSAEKPRRLRRATGTPPRAAFQVLALPISRDTPHLFDVGCLLVRAVGLEPTRRGHWLLRPARLPFRHARGYIIMQNTKCIMQNYFYLYIRNVMESHFPSSLKCPCKRHFIGILKVTADGNTVCKAR